MQQDRYGGCHMSIVVTEQADKIIREQSKAANMSIVDFIVQKALLPIPNGSKLKGKVRKTDSYKIFARNYMKSLKNEKGDEDMEKKEKTVTGAAKNGASKKTAQFHLRVTEAVAKNVQARADEMGMSVSDYITFVVSYYDLESVSMKLDKVIGLLEEWKEGQKKN